MEYRNSTESFEYQDGVQRSAFNVDQIGFELGKEGDFYDAQQNLPGYRSELPHPAAGEFLFDPIKAKSLLSWEQQVKIVGELKAAARGEDDDSPLGIPPFRAAFHVFQSYLAEFGVIFDEKEVCYWLSLAAEEDEKLEVNVPAMAWLWRICEALQHPQPIPIDDSIIYLKFGTVYGFKECAKDWKTCIEKLQDSSEREEHTKKFRRYQNVMRTYAGGVGMRHYFPASILKEYNLSDLNVLDRQIREELDEHYEQYLQITDKPDFENTDNVQNHFDKIYVSNAGHGLLHYAATFGKIRVLEHLLDTYKCNIDRGSSFRLESPLVCAVRSAQHDCAMFLLQRGAHPSIPSGGEDGPLHWLCGFDDDQEEDMKNVAKHLIARGADIEDLSGIDGNKGIIADWDSLLNIPTTPLGRAVIARNDGAIKVLLDLGADPRGKNASQDPRTMSPVEIAAMLFYPEVLQTLLQRVDDNPDTYLFDEAWVLGAAHKRKKDSVDPSCLQSRLARLGSRYKTAILDTFCVIRRSSISNNNPPHEEVLLGDIDIVETLLELGHDPNGTEKFRPLQAATSTGNEAIFNLLLRFGADPLVRYLQPPHNVQMTLLHAIAFPTRGARTTSGAKIAKQLLDAGVPVEEPLEKCPVTPFAQCVMNRNFDVADLLLEHGANLNPVHAQLPGQGPPISLLGSLVILPSQSALESIHYLVKGEPLKESFDETASNTPVAGEGDSHFAPRLRSLWLSPTKPDPIGIPSRKMNVLHLVAHWTPDKVARDSFKTSVDIMELLLDAFDDPAIINQQCPDMGTPLSIAIMCWNINFVRLLLERKADHLISLNVGMLARFAKEVGIDRLYTSGAPLYTSLFVYESILIKIEKEIPENKAPLTIAPLENLFTTSGKIVKLLLPHYQDEEAFQLWEDLQAKTTSLLDSLLQARNNKIQMNQQDAGTPIDLSSLTEEMPIDWEEGSEMAPVAVLRTLLHSSRDPNFSWPSP